MGVTGCDKKGEKKKAANVAGSSPKATGKLMLQALLWDSVPHPSLLSPPPPSLGYVHFSEGIC